MKKITAIILCCCLFLSDARESKANPIAVSGLAAGAAILVSAGAIIYANSPQTQAAVASAAGNIYANTTAYVRTVNAFGKYVYYSETARLKILGQQFINAVQNSASGLYSSIKSRLSSSSSSLPTAGTVVPSPDGNGSLILGEPTLVWEAYQTLSKSQMDTTPYLSPIHGYCQGKFTFFMPIDVYHAQTYCYPYTRTNQAPPPSPTLSPSALPSALGASPSGALPSDVAADVADLIKANPSIAQPVSADGDADSAPPYVPALPAGVSPSTASPSTVTGLGSDNVTGLQEKLAQAQQQLADAQSRVASNPGDAVAQQQLADAQSNVTSITGQLNDAISSTNTTYVAPSRPERKTLNLDSWRNLRNVLSGKFPFTLLLQLSGLLSPLLSDPAAPRFALPIYKDLIVNVDLTFFDTPVMIFRYSISLLITFALYMFLVRWWKGTE